MNEAGEPTATEKLFGLVIVGLSLTVIVNDCVAFGKVPFAAVMMIG